MDIVSRACWYASWCHVCGFKVAKRRWIEEVLIYAIVTRRAPDFVRPDSRPSVAILPS
jgi:hypothetical protein